MVIRKALFSKPAWAAKSPEPFESDEPQSIFQQNVYEDILQEQRRKQERKAARLKEKEDTRRKKEAEGQDTKGDEDGRALKKRRISSTPIDLEQEDEEDDFNQVVSGSDSDSGSTKSQKHQGRNTSDNESELEESSSRNTRKKTRQQIDGPKSGSSTRSKSKAIPVDVEDEDDDELVIYEPEPPTKHLPTQPKPRSKPKPPPPPESESDSEEDEHLKALKRKAREDAKIKNLQATTTNAGTDQTQRSPTHEDNTARGSSTNNTTTPASPQVQIYIHTILPNCKPLGIIRRPSQTLESVHTHFCTTHNISDTLRPKIFFTWNNQKLFKSTTTRSILEQLKRKHGSDKSDGKIVLEAVTEEIYQHRLKAKEDAKRRAEEEADGDNDFETGTGDTDNPTIPPPSGQDLRSNNPDATAGIDPSTSTQQQSNNGGKSPGVIIKLVSSTPDLPPMSLRVHAHTTIDRIVRGYKTRNDVDMGREVYLVFEGERLTGDQTVGDVGFEDGDCVDVRCREP